jgi:hypothetical protein
MYSLLYNLGEVINMKILKQKENIHLNLEKLKAAFEKFGYDDEDIPCGPNCDVIPAYLIPEIFDGLKEETQLDPEDGKIFD